MHAHAHERGFPHVVHAVIYVRACITWSRTRIPATHSLLACRIRVHVAASTCLMSH